jgi:ABC-type Mn2+/Zn2+ transport system ATPase subunit
MSLRLEQISLKHFRGAVQISLFRFDPSKRLVMIFGENGSGKSTLIDAIDLMFNGGKGSLEGRSSTSVRDHLPSLGRSPSDVEIEVGFGSKILKGRFNQSGTLTVTPSAATRHPVVKVLRKSHLSQIVEDTPANRYKVLQPFIEIRGIEKSEAQLTDAVNEVDRRLDDSVRYLGEAQDTLGKLWEAEGRPGSGWLEWAKAKTAQPVDALRRQITANEQLLGHYQQAKSELLSWSQAQQQLDQASENLSDVEAKIEAASVEGSLGVELVRMLEQVASYIEKDQSDTCPVCQQSVSPTTLVEDIHARLKEAARLRALGAEKTSAERAKTAAEAASKTRATSFIDAISRLSDALGLTAPNPEEGKSWLEGLENNGIFQEISEQLESGKKDLESHTAVRLSLEKALDHEKQSQQLEAVCGSLRAMAEIVRQERIRYTQGIFDQVVSECQRMYQRIHPNEDIGPTGLVLDQQRRGSLHQRVKFYGADDVVPQGFFSEAHLDTLAFCFWLAIAKLSQTDAILVIDDVFTSIDAQHLNRIDDLLIEESQHFTQIILTTHYRGWLEKFRYEHPNTLDLHELHEWDSVHGIRSSKTVPYPAELKQVLTAAPMDRQAVASKSGVLLEAILNQFTLEYECSMERVKKGRYDLGQLIAGSAKKMVRLKVEKDNGGSPTVIDLEPVFERIKQLAFLRNQAGAHYNTVGLDHSNTDIKEFGEATLALAEALICNVCGNYVFKRHQITHRDCGGHCKQSRIVEKRSVS